MNDDAEVTYPRYLIGVGEAEAAFVPAEEAKRLLGSERSDVTFYGRVQVDGDYIVSMTYDDVEKELLGTAERGADQ